MQKNAVYSTQMEQVLEWMSQGNYEAAGECFKAVEEYLSQGGDASHLEPELGIVRASLKMAEGDMEGAEQDLQNSLKYDSNNYELYFSLGLCYEQLGRTEEAYYAYRLAVFLGRQTPDEALMQQQFEQLCASRGANAYALGQACQQLVAKRLELGEYERTHAFLGEQLYDRNRVAAKIVLTEENMLLYMMLEIVLCEKNRMTDKDFKKDNTCVRYQNDVYRFRKAYCELKLKIRRIWFGLSILQQKEINDTLRRFAVSPDMLAVVAKYSVRQEFWRDLFARLQAAVQYEFPQTGKALAVYRQWMETQEIGGTQHCMEPVEYDNGAPVRYLKYPSGTDEECCIRSDEDRIAVIFCANDALYTSECIAYLKRLILPEGKRLEIIVVQNAPGMAAGYNAAMRSSPAKIKLYIHQDTFIIRRNILCQLAQAFQEDKKLGMIGIFGSTDLQESAMWYQSTWENSRLNLYQDAVLNILRSVSTSKQGKLEEARAIDGVFIATGTDVGWQEDLFDGWHYYDISQGYEFRKQGLKTVFINDDEIWLLHETTMRRDPEDSYGRYRQIFIETYMKGLIQK